MVDIGTKDKSGLDISRQWREKKQKKQTNKQAEISIRLPYLTEIFTFAYSLQPL